MTFPLPLPRGRIVVLKPPKNLGKKWGHFLKPWESQTRCHSCQNQVLPSNAVPSPTCTSLTRGEMACSWMNHVKRMRIEDKNKMYMQVKKLQLMGTWKNLKDSVHGFFENPSTFFLHLLQKKKLRHTLLKLRLWRRRPTLWPALSFLQPPTSWIWCSSKKMIRCTYLVSQIQLIEHTIICIYIYVYNLLEIWGEHFKKQKTERRTGGGKGLKPRHLDTQKGFWMAYETSPCSISKRPSNSDRNSTPSLLTSSASKSPWMAELPVLHPILGGKKLSLQQSGLTCPVPYRGNSRK